MGKYLKEWSRDDYKVALLDNQNPDSDAWKEIITETAGFEPLEVKFKRMEQAGYRAQFSESEFTSSDLRDIYLEPDFQITPDDELEDVQIKQRQMQDYVQALLRAKQEQKEGSELSTKELIDSDEKYSVAKKETEKMRDELIKQRTSVTVDSNQEE